MILIIEYPFLEGCVKVGVVGDYSDIPDLGEVFLFRAPVPFGSTGSPIVNIQGEVVGVLYYQLREGQRLNYVIPGKRIANLYYSKKEALAEWQARKKEERIFPAERLYLKGLYSVLDENYETGLYFFKKVIEEVPDYAEAYFYMGNCYVSLEQYWDAINAFQQAVNLKPDYFDAYYNLAWTYSLLYQAKEAIEAYKQAINIKPDFVEAHFNLGLIYVAIGDIDAAMEKYRILEELNREMADVLYDQINEYGLDADY